MEIEIKKTHSDHLVKYIELYQICFPNASNLTLEYLSWFYYENPVGDALGADAWHGDQIIGQVIAIPGMYILQGKLVKGLVAVNVAVHPSFQGRHLFKKLGLQMCEYGYQAGYEFVIGVANKAATPGWVRQMKFQLVRSLDAKLGVGDLFLYKNANKIMDSTELRHFWDQNAINWRLRNPMNKLHLNFQKDTGWISVSASTGKYGISAFAEFPMNYELTDNFEASKLRLLFPRVFLGLIPTYDWNLQYVSIPERFKPSPLNLIYKSLTGNVSNIIPSACFINFLDFDAF